MSDYRIKLVDTTDEEIADTLRAWNNTMPQWPKLTEDELDGVACFWWIAYFVGNEPAGMIGIVPALYTKNAGYFKRVYVAPAHRGEGLQRRLMRVMERKARAIGWDWIVSETTDAPHSANNFVKMRYEIFEPAKRWAFQNSIYWRKRL